MYNLKITKNTPDYIFSAIKKYYKNYDGNKIEKHFGINSKQFNNIYQQMDTGGSYDSFDEMYVRFNKDPGTYPDIKISKIKYKNTILLLLSYNKNIITF